MLRDLRSLMTWLLLLRGPHFEDRLESYFGNATTSPGITTVWGMDNNWLQVSIGEAINNRQGNTISTTLSSVIFNIYCNT